MHKNRQILEGILEWTIKQCNVEPCWPLLKMNLKDKEELDRLLGVSFVDAALAASQTGYALYSEDAFFRLTVQNEPFFINNNIWTQIILLWLLAYGSLEPLEYSRLINIVDNQLNYSEVIFSPHTLVTVANDQGWVANENFSNFVPVLDNNLTAEEYATIVAAGFLRYVAAQNLSESEIEAFTNSVVGSLTTNRNTDIVVTKLISIISNSEKNEIEFIIEVLQSTLSEGVY